MSKLFELVVPTYVSVYISHEEFLHVSLYTARGEGGCSIIVRAFFRHNSITRAYTQVQEASQGSM